jgi:hypothetical protein
MRRPHTSAPRGTRTSYGPVETGARVRRRREATAMVRVIGRYAGVLFIIGISASCGLVAGLALAWAPTP